ncbi:MAG TPA: hypothetical protein VGN72_09310 [Tepidisphaeraceae bacterium]|nr:hypothetical protein [Tepidisphaeraceae bacterium]
MAILRVNQLDPATADGVAGWSNGLGQLQVSMPSELHAFELRIVAQEGNSNGTEADQRHRLRQLIIAAAAGLMPNGHHLVLRLDGPLIEIASALAWAIDRPLGMSPVRRFDTTAPSPIVSLRVADEPAGLSGLFDAVGPALGRSVRLRLFAVPLGIVGPLLDMDELDDERWPEVLEKADSTIDTIAGLGGLIAFTHQSADTVTSALASRLSR